MPGWKRGSLAAVLVVLASCKSPPPDVYVAGYDSNDTVYIAMLWKNGAPIALSDGVAGAKAFGVTVSGGDVYVAGISSDGDLVVPTIWKNGVPTVLQHRTEVGVAEAVAVADGVVWATGFVADAPVMWKDGVMIPLTVYGDQGNGVGAGIAVAGGIPYVTGWEYVIYPDGGQSLIRAQARYWKNGQVHPLTDASVSGGGDAIAVSGGDVWVAGWKQGDAGPSVAMLWKNGVEQALTDGLRGAEAHALALDGDTVAVAGGEDGPGSGVAKVWRGGAASDLRAVRAGTLALGIAVDGVEHVVGLQDAASGGQAMYWKGGAPHALTDGSHDAAARAVVVVER
jgi:hypothetical protein